MMQTDIGVSNRKVVSSIQLPTSRVFGSQELQVHYHTLERSYRNSRLLPENIEEIVI